MILRRARKLALLTLLGSCLTLAPSISRAQSSEGSKAAAEALFDEAVKLMEKEDFAAACAKFQASQKLDPALGTVLRLADCFDRVGRTASAWAMFKEAAATAGNRNQQDRERMATERALDLEKRLSRLELRVSPDGPTALELKLNGIVVPAESYNSALPVDPGPQEVEASAPGYKTWRGSIDVPEGPAEEALEIPALENAPEPPKPPVADARVQRRRGSTGATQRTIGFITAGVGLAGLAASGILSYRATELEKDSLQHCRRDDANACTREGVELRNDALDYARVATYPFAAGAALLVGGTLLVLTAPSDRGAASSGPRLTANVSPWHAKFSVESRW
jgi:hypothetical protein